MTAAPVGSYVQVIRFKVDSESIFRDALRGVLVATSDDGVIRRVLEHAAENAAPLFTGVRLMNCPACGRGMRVKNLDEFVAQYRLLVAHNNEMEEKYHYPQRGEQQGLVTVVCDCAAKTTCEYDLGNEGFFMFSHEYLVERFSQRGTTINIETVILL